jgi:hypothetical protein
MAAARPNYELLKNIVCVPFRAKRPDGLDNIGRIFRGVFSRHLRVAVWRGVFAGACPFYWW